MFGPAAPFEKGAVFSDPEQDPGPPLARVRPTSGPHEITVAQRVAMAGSNRGTRVLDLVVVGPDDVGKVARDLAHRLDRFRFDGAGGFLEGLKVLGHEKDFRYLSTVCRSEGTRSRKVAHSFGDPAKKS